MTLYPEICRVTCAGCGPRGQGLLEMRTDLRERTIRKHVMIPENNKTLDTEILIVLAGYIWQAFQ